MNWCESRVNMDLQGDSHRKKECNIVLFVLACGKLC